MAPETKRWLVLLAGFMTCLCESIMYATGVFMSPIMETYHIRGNTAPAALVFSLLVVFIAVGTVLGGLINEKRGTKPPIAAGSVLFASGLFLAALSAGIGSLWLLYVSFGMITGTGVGMIYGSVLGVVAKWFPDRKGFATGVVVCAVGGGPVALAPFAKWLLASFMLSGTYLVFGILTALIMAAALAVLNDPPADFMPAGAGDGAENTPRGRDYTSGEMLRTPLFWLVAFLYMAGTFSGHMVISDAETITREALARSEFAAGAEAYAVAGIMVLAAANAFGRLFWSTLSDRIGRIVTLMIMFAITGCVMLLFNCGGFWRFMAALAVTGCCFGGYLGMFLPICSDFFGNRNITLNYGILYSAFALAGILGPLAGSLMRFSSAVLCAACISFSGLAAAVLVQAIYAGKAAVNK